MKLLLALSTILVGVLITKPSYAANFNNSGSSIIADDSVKVAPRIPMEVALSKPCPFHKDGQLAGKIKGSGQVVTKGNAVTID